MHTQHTPGPWKWYWRNEDGVANCGVFYEPREGMAYSVCRAPQYQTKDQWESDARLIAAAPELLDFAKSYLEWVKPLIKDIGMQEMERKALAAITKAIGEQV